jgi:hypothetical protein
MQWLINEFKDFKAAVQKQIDEAIDRWAAGQLRDAEEFEKLRGEIKAMKARMGKKTPE